MKEHDGCKGCKYEKESVDSKNCIGCVQNAIDKYSKMTNYDMIKNMSVEEMAEILFSSCQDSIGYNEFCYPCDKDSCDKCTANWLNSECGVGE